MTPELIYFIKVNVAIALFYAFYRLFFHRDTFFLWRRVTLLSFFVIAMLHPLLNIQEWIKESEPITAISNLYAATIIPELTVTPHDSSFGWQEAIRLLHILYWVGVAVLCLRFLVQLASIIRLRLRSRKVWIEGRKVYLLTKESSPFSFFRWIFLYPQAHTENEISEIITHEETHVRQWHSVDVILGELMCIACWINPFVWLMKREIRNNLEYMADHQVLETGYDSRTYQYHLLGLAHHTAAAKLTNNFNVLPLKNRIKMMNKKRTRQIGRTKYLMFFPLAALLLIISNIETVARTADNLLLPEKKVTEAATLPTYSSDSKESEQQKINRNDVTERPDKMPEFPGGQKKLMEYVANNMKYPEEAIKKNIQGRTILQFVINKDGSVSDVVVAVSSGSALLDNEAIRLVKSMPTWIPGEHNGKKVNTKYTMPFMFRLS